MHKNGDKPDEGNHHLGRPYSREMGGRATSLRSASV
jgi:hypothetical protein